jgi:hypothetical protein
VSRRMSCCWLTARTTNWTDWETAPPLPSSRTNYVDARGWSADRRWCYKFNKHTLYVWPSISLLYTDTRRRRNNPSHPRGGTEMKKSQGSTFLMGILLSSYQMQ